jgi:hypothetical protein
MTHETHRCSVEGCPSLAAYQVMLYAFDLGEGAVHFAGDETCPYLCVGHAIDNEHGAHGERGMAALVSYPHTNRDRLHGVSPALGRRDSQATGSRPQAALRREAS